jgi:hypothetical protein
MGASIAFHEMIRLSSAIQMLKNRAVSMKLKDISAQLELKQFFLIREIL